MMSIGTVPVKTPLKSYTHLIHWRESTLTVSIYPFPEVSEYESGEKTNAGHKLQTQEN
jgi:hypothetical protein